MLRFLDGHIVALDLHIDRRRTFNFLTSLCSFDQMRARDVKCRRLDYCYDESAAASLLLHSNNFTYRCEKASPHFDSLLTAYGQASIFIAAQPLEDASDSRSRLTMARDMQR